MNSVGLRRGASDVGTTKARHDLSSHSVEEDKPEGKTRKSSTLRARQSVETSNDKPKSPTIGELLRQQRNRAAAKPKPALLSESEQDSDESDAENDFSGFEAKSEQDDRSSSLRERSGRPSRSSTQLLAESAISPPRSSRSSRSGAKRRKLNDDSDAEPPSKLKGRDIESDDESPERSRSRKRPSRNKSAHKSQRNQQNRDDSGSEGDRSESEKDDIDDEESTPKKSRKGSTKAPKQKQVSLFERIVQQKRRQSSDDKRHADTKSAESVILDENDDNHHRYPLRQRSFPPGAFSEKFPPIFRRQRRDSRSEESADDFDSDDSDDEEDFAAEGGDDDDKDNEDDNGDESSSEQIDDADLGDARVNAEMKDRRSKRVRHLVKRYQPSVQIRSRAGERESQMKSKSPRKRDRHRRRRFDSSDSSDNEHFKNLINDAPQPLNASLVGAAAGGLGNVGVAAKADITPLAVDSSITFESIGGLDHHIQSLKEMIMFPLLYPDVFKTLDVTPPKGVLFYGPPGTGKTLVARALANSCSATTPVAFFMRKGADILSKWVGEAERQLRLLFDEARRLQPSIIFFDEIDGLAPVRSSKNDQIHSSIVSTLLALMDGLDNRGQVIVIGATNRIDAIDPALRRPGRFDREFLFSLPSHEARFRIIDIHTSKWDPPLPQSIKQFVADKTVGYCGADLKQLCTESALNALRRHVPQIYLSNDRLLFDPKTIRVDQSDFEAAIRKITPAASRNPLSSVVPRALAPELQPLLRTHLERIADMLFDEIFPVLSHKQKISFGNEEDTELTRDDILLQTLHADSRLKHMAHRPRLLISAPQSGCGQNELLAALLERLESFPQISIDMALLHADSVSRSLEESLVSKFNEATRKLPAVIIIPRVQDWWEQSSSSLKASLLHLLGTIPATAPLLLLATSDIPFDALDADLAALFSSDKPNQRICLPLPDSKARTEYFHSLLQKVFVPPMSVLSTGGTVKRAADLPVLEKAPPLPITRQPSVDEQQRRHAFDEHVKRQMRGEFRDIMERLRSSRSKFAIFWKTLSDANYPEYSQICPNAINLQDLLARIDEGCYITPDQFMEDFNSIVNNATKYFADDDPNGVIPRAKAMQDMVLDMIYDIGDELIALAVDTASRCAPAPKPSSKQNLTEDEDTLKEGQEFRRLSTRVANASAAPAPAHVDPKPVLTPSDTRASRSSHKVADAMDLDEPTPVRNQQASSSSSAAAAQSPAPSTKKSSSTSPASVFNRISSSLRESGKWELNMQELNEVKKKIVSSTSDFTVDQLMFVYVKVHNMIIEDNENPNKKRLVERLSKWFDSLRDDKRP